jgi:hypothetical protein
MKRLITLIMVLGLVIASYGQQTNPKGLYIGKLLPSIAGSLIQRIDSATVDNMANPTKIYFYHGADTIYNPPTTAGSIDGSTVYAPKYILDTLQITDAYTLVLADAGRTIHANKATEVQITVPPEASVNFPIGTVINVEMVGAGIAHFKKGAGVVFESQKDSVCINTRYGWATLRKRAADKWSLFGAILD